MKKLLLATALWMPCHGQEFTIEKLQEALAADLAPFDEVEISPGGKITNLKIKFGESTAQVGEDLFDGFRFKCPAVPEKSDFVWYFNAPENWGNWYILPVTGKPEEAFKGWIEGDKVYEKYDEAGEDERLRILQTLKGKYFTEGTEYIIWFRKTEEGKSSDFRGTMAFVEKEEAWEHESIEEALHLKIASPEDQVAELSSRGGLILLDKEFFTPGYARGRIDSAFYSIRSTKKMQGGFFITTQIAVPPCDSDPKLSAIVAKHGAADFIRSGAEVAKVRMHAGGSPPDEDEKSTTRHYYDHFAFEVDSSAEDPKVRRVVTFGNDFSKLMAPDEGSSFVSMDTENLTLFHKDGKEVGRGYYFLESGKQPFFITEPPVGEYKAGDSILTAKGGGDWIWEQRFDDGQVARRFLLKDHQFEGKAEGFQPNGKPTYIANYHKGLLNGELIEFGKDGEEVSRRDFKEGKPVEE